MVLLVFWRSVFKRVGVVVKRTSLWLSYRVAQKIIKLLVALKKVRPGRCRIWEPEHIDRPIFLLPLNLRVPRAILAPLAFDPEKQIGMSVYIIPKFQIALASPRLAMPGLAMTRLA